jgi:hypothetical protein
MIGLGLRMRIAFDRPSVLGVVVPNSGVTCMAPKRSAFDQNGEVGFVVPLGSVLVASSKRFS